MELDNKILLAFSIHIDQVKDTLLEQFGNVTARNIQDVEQLSSFVTLATDNREDMPASSLVR